jgi:hypothetical protein
VLIMDIPFAVVHSINCMKNVLSELLTIL